MLIFWTFKLTFDEDILAFFGLAIVLATFFQNLGEFVSQSSGHPGGFVAFTSTF